MGLQTNENLTDGNVIKGIVAGVIGGLVASVVMNQFQKSIGKWLIGEERSHGAQSLQLDSPNRGAGQMLKEAGIDDAEDDAPERMANAIAFGTAGIELNEKEKAVAASVFHYGFGTSMGALYGAAAEVLPPATLGAGSAFGAAVWLGADEVVVPMLGLSKVRRSIPSPFTLRHWLLMLFLE